MPQTGRMYLCARCRAQVVVCRRCDRGQIYCPSGFGPSGFGPTGCAVVARREAQRAAGRRYQSSRRGRFVHAERARRYRDRKRNRCKIVTHQGSVVALASDLLPLKTTVAVRGPATEPFTEAAPGETVVIERSLPACTHCGARCPAGVRFGFVRHHFVRHHRTRSHQRIADRLIGARPSRPLDDHWP